MDKALRTLLPLAGIAIGGAAAAAFMLAPARAPEEKKAPFMGANIAHRGLHKADRSVPENSLAAFKAAVDAGYGVEFDVHMTSDGHIAVFHDDTLSRMCGVEGKVENFSLEELSALTLAGTGETIPSLDEVLETIGGKVPVVLEIKRGGRNTELCEKVYEALEPYCGDVCIESFDPMIVCWWYKNAPEYLRGQLSTRPEKFGKNTGRMQAFMLGHLLTNFLCRPHFIAYGICEKKPFTVRLCERMGAMRIAWTSHGYASEKTNDAVIFEYYRPKLFFK